MYVPFLIIDLERADELVGLPSQAVGNTNLRELHSIDNTTSGSGSGMPQLVSRTLSKTIEKQEIIGEFLQCF